MDLRDSRHGDVVVLEVAGDLDSRTAHEFEKRIVDLLGEGSRRFAIDFRKVDQLTSAGLRVLVMLANRLAGIDGRLALAAPNDHVRQVLEISGLTGYFHVTASREEAIVQLSSVATPSRVSVLAMKLLAGGTESGARGKRSTVGDPPKPAGASSSKLSSQVAEILSRPRKTSAEDDRRAGKRTKRR